LIAPSVHSLNRRSEQCSSLALLTQYKPWTPHPVQDPVRTNKIPRQVPEQAWYMHPAFSVLIGGILPFGAVFIELFFILTSMWLHQVRAGCTMCASACQQALPLQNVIRRACNSVHCGRQCCQLRSAHAELRCMLLVH
jgi:Endomembrane protein 70